MPVEAGGAGASAGGSLSAGGWGAVVSAAGVAMPSPPAGAAGVDGSPPKPVLVPVDPPSVGVAGAGLSPAGALVAAVSSLPLFTKLLI